MSTLVSHRCSVHFPGDRRIAFEWNCSFTPHPASQLAWIPIRTVWIAIYISRICLLCTAFKPFSARSTLPRLASKVTRSLEYTGPVRVSKQPTVCVCARTPVWAFATLFRNCYLEIKPQICIWQQNAFYSFVHNGWARSFAKPLFHFAIRPCSSSVQQVLNRWTNWHRAICGFVWISAGLCTDSHKVTVKGLTTYRS